MNACSIEVVVMFSHLAPTRMVLALVALVPADTRAPEKPSVLTSTNAQLITEVVILCLNVPTLSVVTLAVLAPLVTRATATPIAPTLTSVRPAMVGAML
jgi:hypothetical protein